MSDRWVAITLIPINHGESPQTSRTLDLTEEDPVIFLGRSSKREGRNREPAYDNGWFSSRVMSREHAELSFCGEKRNVYICDSGSTHGTWLNNLKLIPEEKTILVDGDTIRFGIDVDRGDEEFPALSVNCEIEWFEPSSIKGIPKPCFPKLKPNANTVSAPENGARPTSSSNTFCVPEDDSDAEELPIGTTTFIETNAAAKDAFIPDMENLNGIVGLNDEKDNSWLHLHDPGLPRALAVCDSEDDSASNSEEEYSEGEYSEDESDLESSKSNSSHTSESAVVTDETTLVQRPETVPNTDPEEDSEPSESDEADCIDPSVLSSNCNPETGPSDKFAEWMGVQASRPINPIKFRDSPNSFPKSHPLFNAEEEEESIISLAPFQRPPSPQGYKDGPFSWNCHSLPQPIPQPTPTLRPTFSISESLRQHVSTDQASPLKKHQDLIDRLDQKSSPMESNSSPIKRKFSEMESQDTPQDAQVPDLIRTAMEEPDLDPISQSQVVSAITSALSEADDQSESQPPTKRIKPTPTRSNNLAGYTATAVVSALLGGLGTIALLAALPAEYFQ